MGKDADGRRAKTKAASAARAGELLGSGPATPAGLGLGFGGFVGAQSLAAPRAASESPGGAADAPGLLGVDGEVQLHLRRLSKRDATTKLKALQALRALVKEKPAAELEALLPAWAHVYQRLALDNARALREEAAGLLGLIAGGVGRGLAPFLKQLAGPWFMCRFDPQPEVSKAARAAMAAVFPGPKLQEALAFCNAQIVAYLLETLSAAPEALGDAQRESPEELGERQQRAQAACLAALAELAEAAAAAEGGSGELAERLGPVLARPGFAKGFLGSKSPQVRRAAYAFYSRLAARCPSLLEGSVAGTAGPVLGAFADRDPSTHGQLWGMVLCYSRAFPAAWRAADARKAVLPKLAAFLRSGCHGSAEASFPALYPLLTLLPAELLAPDPRAAQSLLEAVLLAWAAAAAGSAPGAGAAAAAAAAAFAECWAFVMAQDVQAAAADVSAAEAAVAALVSSPLCARLLPLALAFAEDVSGAAAALLGRTLAATPAGEPALQPRQALLLGLGQALQQQLLQASADGSRSHCFARAEALLLALEAADSDGGAVARLLAEPLARALAAPSGGGGGSPQAAQLLAFLIRRFGASGHHAGGAALLADGAPDSLAAGQQAFREAAADGPEAAARADVLVALLLRTDAPAAALAQTLSRLLTQEGGAAKAALLLQRLLAAETHAAAGEPGAALAGWRSEALDGLAQEQLLPRVVGGEEAAGQLLGALVAGDGAASLLSQACVSRLLSELRASVAGSAGISAAAACCLRACLLAAAAWADAAPAAELLAAVYGLAGTGDEAAAGVWQQGRSLLGLCSQLPAEASAAAQQHLVAALCSSLRSLLASQQAGSEWADAFAARVAELQHALPPAHGGAPAAAVFASMQPLWPRFVSPEEPQAAAAAAAAELAAGGKHAAANAVAAAAAVWRRLGGEPDRPWVAAELLCCAAAGEPAALELRAQLSSVLVERHASQQAAGSPCARVLERLWASSAGGSAEAATRAEAALALLEQLLAHNSGSTEDAAAAAAWVASCGALLRAWAGGHSLQRASPPAAKAFALLASQLRMWGDTAAIESSGLAAAAHASLAALGSQPALWQAMQADHSQAAGVVRGLHAVEACFPVPLAWPADRLCALDSERAQLAALTERQLSGERAATAAEAALRRAQPEAAAAAAAAASEPEARELSGEAEAAHASLLLAAAAYSWGQMRPELQAAAVRRLEAGAGAAAVALEGVAEAAAEAAVAAAAKLSSQQGLTPRAAVTLLLQVQQSISEAAARLFQEAVEGVELLLADTDTTAGLTEAPRAWLAAAAAVLPRLPATAVDSLASDIFRCVLCVGVVAAVGQAAGEGGRLVLQHWLGELRPLLQAAAACCARLLPCPRQLAEACRAADAWSEETGVDTIGASLALLSCSQGLPGLQRAALHALLQPGVLPRLVDDVGDEEDEAAAEGRAAAEAAHDEVALLASAGLRPELAAAIAEPSPDASSGESSDEEGAPGEARAELLAWAALLAHILSLEPGSRQRVRVCQAVHDTHRLVPRLLYRLVDLLPLEAARESARTPARPAPAAAAAAAAADRAAGRGAVAWSFADALTAAGSLTEEALAPDLFRATLRALPASARAWFQGIRDKKLSGAVEAYTARRESGWMISEELAGVAGHQPRGEETDAGNIEFSIRAKPASREAVALVSLEDSAVLELSIQLPVCWPLQDAKVDCRRGMGVAESRLRKWMLSITALLRSQNSTLLDAVSLWQRNCARQFAGVEDCLICYNVILAGTGQLPKLACRTCHKRFHGACLYKWFRSSGKSVCPHCQSAW